MEKVRKISTKLERHHAEGTILKLVYDRELIDTFPDIAKLLTHQAKTIERQREALERYADPNNWENTEEDGVTHYDCRFRVQENHKGMVIAKDALEPSHFDDA